MIYEKTEYFFIQKIKITNILEKRFDFFKKLCFEKNVLHIGCADSQCLTENNLHIEIKKVSKKLDGMDIDKEYLEKLNQICPGNYFSSLKECEDNYDIVLVPEVLEHVLNINYFLNEVFDLKFKEIIITAPNIIHYQKEMIKEGEFFKETIHPDHKCWFSPYTLYNCVKPYIKNEENCKMYFLDEESMVAIHIINGGYYDSMVE